jgi:hypothetical protein
MGCKISLSTWRHRLFREPRMHGHSGKAVAKAGQEPKFPESDSFGVSPPRLPVSVTTKGITEQNANLPENTGFTASHFLFVLNELRAPLNVLERKGFSGSETRTTDARGWTRMGRGEGLRWSFEGTTAPLRRATMGHSEMRSQRPGRRQQTGEVVRGIGPRDARRSL